MERSQWFGRRLGVAVVAWASVSQVAVAEQPLEQLPKDVASFSLSWVALPRAMVEVTKDHGPLAGASWGVIKGTSEVAGRVLNLMDESPASERRARILARRNGSIRGDEAHSPTWLNLDNGGSRQMRHEPALLRYTF